MSSNESPNRLRQAVNQIIGIQPQSSQQALNQNLSFARQQSLIKQGNSYSSSNHQRQASNSPPPQAKFSHPQNQFTQQQQFQQQQFLTQPKNATQQIIKNQTSGSSQPSQVNSNYQSQSKLGAGQSSFQVDESVSVDNGMTPAMRMMFHEKFSIRNIAPDTWLNIPVCVVKAFKQLIDSLDNTQIAMRELNERQNDREKASLVRLRKMELLMNEKDQTLHQELDNNEQLIFDKIRRIQSDVEHQQKGMETKLNEMLTSTFQDREFMHSKLRGVEDSEVIRVHIQKELKVLEERINQQQFDFKNQIDSAFEELKRDNLVVPGLIGSSEAFENMQSWVSFMHTNFKSSLSDLEIKYDERIYNLTQQNSQDQSEIQKNIMSEIKTSIKSMNDSVNEQIISLQTQFGRDLQERIVNVKGDQSSMTNQIQFLQSKIDQVTSEIKELRIEMKQEEAIEQLKESMQGDFGDLKDDCLKQVSKMEDDIKAYQLEREQIFKKQMDKLKEEIRVGNIEKQKTQNPKLELTDKLKRQITEMITQTVQKLGTSVLPNQSQKTDKKDGKDGKTSISQSSEAQGKLKNSVTSIGRKVTLKEANEHEDAEVQNIAKKNYLQHQQTVHARARSTLETYSNTQDLKLKRYSRNGARDGEKNITNQNQSHLTSHSMISEELSQDISEDSRQNENQKNDGINKRGKTQKMDQSDYFKVRKLRQSKLEDRENDEFDPSKIPDPALLFIRKMKELKAKRDQEKLQQQIDSQQDNEVLQTNQNQLLELQQDKLQIIPLNQDTGKVDDNNSIDQNLTNKADYQNRRHKSVVSNNGNDKQTLVAIDQMKAKISSKMNTISDNNQQNIQEQNQQNKLTSQLNQQSLEDLVFPQSQFDNIEVQTLESRNPTRGGNRTALNKTVNHIPSRDLNTDLLLDNLLVEPPESSAQSQPRSRGGLSRDGMRSGLSTSKMNPQYTQEAFQENNSRYKDQQKTQSKFKDPTVGFIIKGRTGSMVSNSLALNGNTQLNTSSYNLKPNSHFASTATNLATIKYEERKPAQIENKTQNNFLTVDQRLNKIDRGRTASDNARMTTAATAMRASQSGLSNSKVIGVKFENFGGDFI